MVMCEGMTMLADKPVRCYATPTRCFHNTVTGEITYRCTKHDSLPMSTWVERPSTIRDRV